MQIGFTKLCAVSLLMMMFAPSAFADTSTERAYAAVQEAAERCKTAWFQSSREQALKDLNDAGLTLATTLNPLGRDYEKHKAYLEAATRELRNCTKIVYAD